MARGKKKSGKPGRASAKRGSPVSELKQDLRDVLTDIARWLHAGNRSGAIVGAIGVSLQGYVRTTNDVDFMVCVDSIEPHTIAEILDSLPAFGFSPRANNLAEFALQSHVLLLLHGASGVTVDLALGMMPLEQEIAARADRKRIGSWELPVASVESLCLMKIIAARPRDMDDVAGLVEIYPGLDREWIMNYVRQYAELMDSPDRVDIAVRLLGEGGSA
jgi:hypothetical protein